MFHIRISYNETKDRLKEMGLPCDRKYVSRIVHKLEFQLNSNDQLFGDISDAINIILEKP